MIKRNESGEPIAVICSRPSRCAYCEKVHTKLCDFVKADGKTCDTPMCAAHAWRPDANNDADYCRPHRRQMEEPMREEKRKAELMAKKRGTLIYFAQSKYGGACREKDCGGRWEQGEPCWWDSQTREAFCVECGDLMVR